MVLISSIGHTAVTASNRLLKTGRTGFGLLISNFVNFKKNFKKILIFDTLSWEL